MFAVVLVGSVIAIARALPAADCQVGCVPVPAGLVSWWDGDEVLGTTVIDIQDGNDGALIGGATIAPGKVGHGIVLDGVDDRVRVPGTANLDITGDVTVDLWAQRASFSSNQVLIKKGALAIGGVDAPAAYGLEFLADDTILAGFERADGSNAIIIGPAITDTDFHHYAYVRSGNLHELYVDGVVVADDTFAGSPGSTAGIDLVIGAHRHEGGAVHFFDGTIDEVEVFNRALTASEIQAIFSAGSAGKCKGCPCNLLTTTDFSEPMGKKKKLGSTLPIKFKLYFDGVEIQGQDELDAILEANGCQAACPEIDIFDVTDAAEAIELDLPEDLGNVGEGGDLGFCFRYSDGNWVYNLELDPGVFASDATYLVEVVLPDCVLTPGNDVFQTK